MTLKILFVLTVLVSLCACSVCAAASPRTARLAVIHTAESNMMRTAFQNPPGKMMTMADLANSPRPQEPEPEIFTVKAGDKIKNDLIEIIDVSDNAVKIKMQAEFCDTTTSSGKQGREYTVERGQRPLELSMIGLSDASVRYKFWLTDEEPQASATSPVAVWKCVCGKENKGKYCTECGRKMNNEQ